MKTSYYQIYELIENRLLVMESVADFKKMAQHAKGLSLEGREEGI